MARLLKIAIIQTALTSLHRQRQRDLRSDSHLLCYFPHPFWQIFIPLIDSFHKAGATYRVGADIGGTFTDLIIVNSQTGEFSIGKTLTTPEDPSIAVETALKATLQDMGVHSDQVSHLIHGTTLVTNAMIERKGAKTALMTTAGFRDSVEIGRETRYDLYDLMLEQPKPLVPRHLRFDIPQRTLANGKTHESLDIKHVQNLATALAAKGVDAIAVCFLHSYVNPTDERAARDAIADVAPDLRVSISSDVVAEIREFERALDNHCECLCAGTG